MVCAAAEIGAFGWACSLSFHQLTELPARPAMGRIAEMKILMLLLGLVGISAQALGETARTQAAATPGSVTFGELEGFIIEADIVRDQLTQRDGRQVPQQAHTSWRIVIGPEVSIQSTVNVTFYNPHGQRKAEPLTGSFILDQSRHVGSRGGGQGVWHFEEGTLTFTRTFEQGAFRIKFAFSRKDEGLSCQASESFARENGTGPIAMQSAINGQPITMIRAKQISSNCRLFKGM
jgi:hypothetical protein